MPIDTSIYNNIQPLRPDGQVNMLAQIAQLQQAGNQNKLFDLTFAEKQREADQTNALNDLYKSALGTDGKIDRSKLYTGAAEKGLGAKLPAMQKGFAETDAAETKLSKEKTELIDAKIKQSRQYLDTVQTPEQYIAWHEANHKDPVLGPALAARGVTAEQARASIMQAIQQPGGFERLLKQSQLGIEKFAETYKPKVETRNLGGTTDTLLIDPLTGKPTLVNSARNTQSPDSRATDARERQRMANDQNTPQYMETDQGIVALPKKLPKGQAPVGQPVSGTDGQPLQKKLKDIPATVNTAIVENANALRKIDDALNAVKQYPDGLGMKNMLSDTIRQRTDPQGVDVRALIADIGSLKLHDRSGAAVTASESPRLMPFIPTVNDDPATVERKLKQFRREYESVQNDTRSIYSKEQGYKPAPTLSGPTAAGVPADIAALLQKHGGK